MAEPDPIIARPRETRPLRRPESAVTEPSAQEFQQEFGEPLSEVLDLGSWQTGRDLAREYARVEREVREALGRESDLYHRVRAEVFPKIVQPNSNFPTGVFAAHQEALEMIHHGLLFNGGVEACDGTVQVFDTLPLTVYQVGISLVSYRGDQGTWQQQLFRRDLRQNDNGRVEETLDELERRSRRSALNHANPTDPLGELARKAVMDYAERAVLLHRSSAVWRIGHGNPVTYELLTAAGILELMEAGTNAVRGLVERRQFVFVASEPRERFLLTIGQALPPMHYALVCSLEDRVSGWFHQHRFSTVARGALTWDGEPIAPEDWIPRFLRQVASQVIVGLYRASAAAPAQLFYAHRDHAHMAAHVVLADSMLQEHRGFPLLIDLAHHVCGVVFGGSLTHLTEAAYAAVGEPWRFQSERASRGH